MSLEWESCKIGELGKIFSGGTPSTKIKEYWDGDLNWLSSGETRNTYIYTTDKFITEKGANNSSTKLANKGDIVIASAGQGFTRGQSSMVMIDTYVNQSVIVISPNDKVNNHYLLYNLKFRYPELRQLSDHASTRGSLTTKIIKDLDIILPDLNTQNKIATIIQYFDKKIETNKKINKNLTKLIDTNFKNYLLNFENYSEDDLVSSEFGPIPKEWEVNNLTGIANYQNGLAMQKFPPETPEDSFKVLKIKELRQGFFDESSDLCSKNIKEECIVYDGDVIFSWSGSLLVDIWTGGTCGLNQHLFKVTSSNFDKWFYYCWTKFYLDQFILIAKDKATTMGHIKRQHLEESLVLIPDEETYNNLTNLFKPLFEYLTKNKIEIKKLQSLRDTLLPKLMSGEIDVSKINCDMAKISRNNCNNMFTLTLKNNLIEVIS